MVVRALGSLTLALFLSSWIDVPRPATLTKPETRVAPMILGVNTHFGSKVAGSNYLPDQAAGAIRSLGYESWRDVVSMGRYARLRAGSTLEKSVLRQFDAFATSAAVPQSPLLIVNTWPDGSTPANRVQAFASALQQGLTAFPRGSLIEIWNEWDKNPDNQTSGTVESYGTLVGAAAPAIRRALPGAKVLIGGAADDQQDLEFRWTRALLRRPEAALADGVSVHIYNHCNPTRRNKAAADMIGRLDRLRADMVSIGKSNMQVYVSEFGWPTDGGACHISPEEAAAALVQFTLLADSRPWVAGVWYYELKDSGTKPDDIESHFGLYDFNMTPKPGACTATLVNQLVRRGVVLRTYEGDDLTGVVLRTAGGVQTIAWATKANTPAILQIPKSVVARPFCAPPQQAGGSYRLSGTPVILPGDILPRGDAAGGTMTLR
ncbi:hypothetical protein [Sphingomonas sp. NPDC079357]|uniref:hypothetical protein n=1 Tax=Sphingomonas sp. NPDC079357 TaxID=3364518 RepID=UPI00384DD53D